MPRTLSALLRRVAPLLLAFSTGGAFAAGGGAAPGCAALGTEGQVAHSAEWVCAVTDMVNRLRLFEWIDGIAWLVLLSFFVARTLSISMGPNAGPKLRNLMMGSLVAFGLMSSLTPVRSMLLDVWRESYTFSQSHGADAVWHSLAVLAEDLGAEDVSATLTGLTISDQMGEEVFDVSDAGAVAGGVTGVAAAGGVAHRIGRLSTIARGVSSAGDILKSIPVFRIVDAILLPIMSLYSMIVFGSALTIILGALLLPIGAIMIVSGNGGQFFSNWTNVMLASIITMVVFPIMWGVTTQVAFITPFTSFLEGIGELHAEYETTMEEIAEPGFTLDPVKHLSAKLDKAWAGVGVGVGYVSGIMTMLVQLVIGVVTAFGLIFLLQQIVTRFIGGVVANAQSFGRTFGMLGGKGGGKKTTTNATQETTTTNTTTQTGNSGGGGTGGSERTLTTAGNTGTTSSGPLRNQNEPIPVPPAPAPTHASGSARQVN